MDESSLIKHAQRGDAQALAQLFQTHYDFLRKYLIKITMQPHLADDLVQETMIRCMEKIHQYNGQTKFSSWLITIGSRLYIDHLRKGKREQRLHEQEQAIRQLRWQADTSAEGWNELLDVLSELPPDTRMPVIMKHYYGYSQDEIADMLGIPSGTVKSRIHNGIKQVRKEMGIFAAEK